MSLICFSGEQKMIEKEIRKFSQTELEPICGEIDKNGVFPVEVVKKLSDLGFLSLIIPEKYGGAGLDTISLCIVLEELSKVSASVGTILAVNNCLIAFPLTIFELGGINEYFLKKLVDGEIGGYVTDLEINTSIVSIDDDKTCTSVSVSGKRDFVLNGEVAKIFIMPVSSSNGDVLCVFEKTDDMLLDKQDILGLRAAGITGCVFNTLKMPRANCLMDCNTVTKVIDRSNAYANIGLAAVSLGIAESAYDVSVKYSKERKQFGKTICEFPMIQEMLVYMKEMIEAVRLLVYDAAHKCDKGEHYSVAAHIARLCSNKTAVYSGTTAVQVHGGYGYTKDYPVERYFRDAKALQVLKETPHDLKLKIAKELLV